eukprot:scaffold46467_cov20-Tisochrysis_lutea.AAC.2
MMLSSFDQGGRLESSTQEAPLLPRSCHVCVCKSNQSYPFGCLRACRMPTLAIPLANPSHPTCQP